MPCAAWYRHARVEPCVFGNDEATRTVVLLGDSIGAQWFSAVPAIFPAPEWLTVVLTKSACPLVDEEYFYARIGQPYTVCTEWRNAVLDDIETHKPDVVIAGSYSPYPFSENQWVEGSARVFERLAATAGTVLVVPGTPSLSFDGPGCVARNLSANGEIKRTACIAADRVPIVAPVTRYLERAAARFDNVHLLDLNDLVCPGGVCSAIDEDGVVVFRDSQHLTDSFVRANIPEILRRIEALGAPAFGQR